MSARRDSLIEKHYQRMLRAAGVDIVFHRGGVDSGQGTCSLRATVGMQRFELTDAHGFKVESHGRVYILKAADLVIDDEIVEPAAGDVFEEIRTEDGAAGDPGNRRFDVRSPGGDLPEWSWSDPDQTWRRVHNKFVAEVTVP